MKPIDQDSFSDEAKGTHGNCYAACIASILERPLEDLAEFSRLYLAYHGPALQGHHDFAARAAYERELHRLGIHPVHVPAPDSDSTFIVGAIPKGYSIASGPGPRDLDHSCVALDGAIVHDPHPSRDGLVQIACYEALIPVISA